MDSIGRTEVTWLGGRSPQEWETYVRGQLEQGNAAYMVVGELAAAGLVPQAAYSYVLVQLEHVKSRAWYRLGVGLLTAAAATILAFVVFSPRGGIGGDISFTAMFAIPIGIAFAARNAYKLYRLSAGNR